MRTLALTFVTVTFLTGCQESPTGRDRLALVPDAALAEHGRSFERTTDGISFHPPEP
ncbi:hypothetical protein [Marinobacter sp. es.048]|uniref:hypothetical protein n=1 Tax=Marinobacter sp. es.048 TaxID=1761795 RepID=UPI00155269E6|nr:hypothetical protein [Marinobacter sp. es.048]